MNGDLSSSSRAASSSVMVPVEETVVVVPCYNEAARLDQEQFTRLAASERLCILFVNDGSTDSTAEILEDMAGRSQAIDVLHLETNGGKAEAVRFGLRAAIDRGASVVSYYDADLATPPEELLRLLATLERRPDIQAAFGARIARLGTAIDRKASRHLLGRLFATASSLALGVHIYDTQCGAKAFRVNPALQRALECPFQSSWSFDVRLIDRLLSGGDGVPGVDRRALMEVPLDMWREVDGSKMRMSGMAAAFTDVLRLGVTRHWQARRHEVTDGLDALVVELPGEGERPLVLDLSDVRPSAAQV